MEQNLDFNQVIDNYSTYLMSKNKKEKPLTDALNSIERYVEMLNGYICDLQNNLIQFENGKIFLSEDERNVILENINNAKDWSNKLRYIKNELDFILYKKFIFIREREDIKKREEIIEQVDKSDEQKIKKMRSKLLSTTQKYMRGQSKYRYGLHWNKAFLDGEAELFDSKYKDYEDYEYKTMQETFKKISQKKNGEYQVEEDEKDEDDFIPKSEEEQKIFHDLEILRKIGNMYLYKVILLFGFKSWGNFVEAIKPFADEVSNEEYVPGKDE